MFPINMPAHEFNQQHGGQPIESESRFYWPDGWSTDLDRRWSYPHSVEPIDLLKAKNYFVDL